MPKKRKHKGTLGDATVDLSAIDEKQLFDQIATSGDPMENIRSDYYTPQLDDNPFPNRPDSFVEAAEQESDALKKDLVKSDRLTLARNRGDSGMDSQYFFCVVFVSNEQRKAFLEKTGWHLYTDSTNQYLNGILLAQEMGIPLPEGYLAGALIDFQKE